MPLFRCLRDHNATAEREEQHPSAHQRPKQPQAASKDQSIWSALQYVRINLPR